MSTEVDATTADRVTNVAEQFIRKPEATFA